MKPSDLKNLLIATKSNNGTEKSIALGKLTGAFLNNAETFIRLWEADEKLNNTIIDCDNSDESVSGYVMDDNDSLTHVLEKLSKPD